MSSSKQTKPPDCYLGIDVSKGYADFCLLSGSGDVLREEVLDDTAAGHERLRELIEHVGGAADVSVFEVGLEATGGGVNPKSETQS